MATMENVLTGRDLQAILRHWEERHQQTGFDPEAIVTRISEILEEETEIYMRKNPDPFDERHPSRMHPECELGRMLKSLFRKDNFMNRLVNDYLKDNYFTNMQNVNQSSRNLNIAACRLILVIMPGLETSAVFQVEFDHLITRLYNWAETAEEPLQSYAVGLLGAAMDVQEIATAFREHNVRLLPKVLERIHKLQRIHKGLETPDGGSECGENASSSRATEPTEPIPDRPFAAFGVATGSQSPRTSSSQESPKMNGIFRVRNSTDRSENSQSRDITTQSPMSYPILYYPPTIESSQRLILRYLSPMGEYQEFLPCIFENNAMQLIFRYIENIEPKDMCLAFEALKYLASLLCHKKFTLEFLANGGLEKLLKVPFPSIAATGASVAFYYMAYCEEAIERICQMQPKLIKELVSYELALLSRCKHDSGRCHATMFFGLSFQFKIMLDEFDRQDGLRKLLNVISVLPILSNSDDYNLNDDEECAMRQVMRHVCVTMKKYFESHLYYKYTQVTRQENPQLSAIPLNSSVLKAPKSSMDVINEQIRCLQETIPMRSHWQPLDEFINLGGITVMLRIIALSYEWNSSRTCIAETVRSALDILNVGCVFPKVHQIFCERIDFPDEASAAGLNIVLGAAEGEIVSDAEVQKSALSVLVNSVCAPVHRPSGSVARYGSAKKKTTNKYSEELIQKVWECVRSNNGIIVLLSLMQAKTPITDADCMRGMACRALAGLARSETVKQIISKLPLFTNGQLQQLVRDPILQEKRSEHVQFQKYALELMERVSGRTKPVATEMDTSLINIHKANIVAQTKIQFNEQQLNLLIYQHLAARGLTETAATLLKEAQLKGVPQTPKVTAPLSPFNFRSPSVSMIARSRLRGKVLEHSFPPVAPSSEKDLNSSRETLISESDESVVTTPIKLIRKASSTGSNMHLVHQNQTNHQRSLQKQVSSETFISTAPRNVQQEGQSRGQSNITLDTIITEFLTNQHSLCKHPMSTCPQFDLFRPHKCPDPRPNKHFGVSTNFAARFSYRQSGFRSQKLDRRLVHSSFAVSKVIRTSDSDSTYTSCEFTPDSSQLVVGLQSGEVKCYSISEGTEEYSYNCHESNITSLKFNREGNLLLTGSSWRAPLTALWGVANKQITPKFQWEDQEHCVFSNWVQDRILGTKSEEVTIFDINTGQKIVSLVPQNCNQYTKNVAVFDPTDELILSDGVLWDVRAGKEIHKFDKLNQNISGVFHPNGLEVISNTEVWDLRTFHLLRTVPALDQSQIAFSPLDTIYAISSEVENSVDMDNYSSFESSFKILDSTDYSAILTHDVKRHIYDLCVNKTGLTIAIVENQGGYDSVQESVVRVYAVGSRKSNEDEMEEEDDEVEASDASDSDNDHDSDDDGFQIRRNNRPRDNQNVNGNAEGGDEADVDVASSSSSSSDIDGDSSGSWTTDSDGPMDFDSFDWH